jgi:hypothetical protein
MERQGVYARLCRLQFAVEELEKEEAKISVPPKALATRISVIDTH